MCLLRKLWYDCCNILIFLNIYSSNNYLPFDIRICLKSDVYSDFVLYSSFDNYLYFVSFAIYLFAGLYIFLHSPSPWKLHTFCLVCHLFFCRGIYIFFNLPLPRGGGVEIKLNWAGKYTPLFNFFVIFLSSWSII